MKVHKVNRERADKIKNDHQDKLRSKWHRAMTEIEVKRASAQKAEETLRRYSGLVNELEDWLKCAPLKLERANNYEGQIESFAEEFDDKQRQVHAMNELSSELKTVNVGFSETQRYQINAKWHDISVQFKRFSGSKDKDKLVTDKKVEVVGFFFFFQLFTLHLYILYFIS